MVKLNKFKKVRNIAIYLLSFTASLIGIGLNFFLARVLEAEYFGRIQYLVALSTTCSQLLIFGLNMFLIRESKNEKQRGEVVNKCFSLFLGIVLFFVPIIYFVLSHYVSVTSNNLLISSLVTIVAVLMGANTLITSYFQGSGKYHLSIIFENLLPKLMLLITAVVFLLIGKMMDFQDNYLIFYIIFYSIIAIPFIVILFRKINFSFTRAELGSVVFFFGVTVTYSLGNNLTKVLQGGFYKNNIALGIISVSISIISLVRVFTSVLDNMIKPIFAKKGRENDIDGLLETYRFETRTNSYVSIPLFLFFVFNPTHFLSIFGDSYLEYPRILTIIALANAVSDLTGSNGTLLAMTGKERWELFNGLLYFGVYFLSIFVFSFDKVYGLCYALLVAQISVNIAKYVEVWLIYKHNPLNNKTLISILITILINGIPIFALQYLSINNVLWLVVGGCIGVVLVILNFFVISLYRKNDFKTLLELRL